MSRMKPCTAIDAFGPSDSLAMHAAAASQSDEPAPFACSRMMSSDFAPMPRVGRFTTRSNEASSRRLESSRRYASASLISARSKNRRPPYTRYGMRAEMNASSNTRDCAFERYSTAVSRREPPVFDQSLMRWTMNSASSRSLNEAYSRIGSPFAPLVHRFLPRRPLLFEMSAFAASRIDDVER